MDVLQHLDDWRRWMKTVLSSSLALGRNYNALLTDGNPLLIITEERTYRCGNMKSYWWKYQSHRQASLTLSWCQHSALAAGHCLSHNIDMHLNIMKTYWCPVLLQRCNWLTAQSYYLYYSGRLTCVNASEWKEGFIWLVSITLKHTAHSLKTAVVPKPEQWKMWQLWQISGFITEQ